MNFITNFIDDINLKKLWDLLALVVVCVIVTFIGSYTYQTIFTEAVFQGYYTQSQVCNTQIYYIIKINWKNAKDGTAFITTDVNEFYRACDRLDIKMAKLNGEKLPERKKEAEK